MKSIFHFYILPGCVFTPESFMKMNVVSQREKLLLQNMKTHKESHLILPCFCIQECQKVLYSVTMYACCNRSVPLVFCSAGWSPLESL